MGFSFIKLYEWLVEKGIADKEVPTDDFIQKGLNGFNSSIFTRWYDKHREMEVKLKVAVEQLEVMRVWVETHHDDQLLMCLESALEKIKLSN